MTASNAAREARKGPVRPARPLSPEQRQLLETAPPAVMRTLHLIAEERLLHGRGPNPRAVWGAYVHGNPHASPPRGADAIRPTLEGLRPYGVRFDLARPDGGIGLSRPVYNVLRPAAVATLTARGQWPRRDRQGKVVRWRGPKRGVK